MSLMTRSKIWSFLLLYASLSVMVKSTTTGYPSIRANKLVNNHIFKIIPYKHVKTILRPWDFGTNLQSVKRIKIVTPTEIQQKAIPLLLANKTDVVQKTGTEKNSCFGLPLYN
jgi:hypothetical protein